MNYKRNNKTLIIFSIVIVILLVIYLKISFRNVSTDNDINAKLNDAITLIFKEDDNIQAPEQLTNSILNKLEEIGADLTTIGNNSVSFYPTSDNYTSLWFFININNKNLIVQCEYNNSEWIVKYIENKDTNIFYYVPSNVNYEDIYSIIDDSLIQEAETTKQTTINSIYANVNGIEINKQDIKLVIIDALNSIGADTSSLTNINFNFPEDYRHGQTVSSALTIDNKNIIIECINEDDTWKVMSIYNADNSKNYYKIDSITGEQDKDIYKYDFKTDQEIQKPPYMLDNTISNELSSSAEDISTSPVYKVKYGILLSSTVTDLNGQHILVVKAKIKPNLTNHLTIAQNYSNVVDVIRNQGGNAYDKIDYWAVADMEDGSEGKVISFTLNKDVIDAVKKNNLQDVQLEDYVSDLYILPSLLE